MNEDTPCEQQENTIKNYYWEDITEVEKIERMRTQIKSLQDIVVALGEKIQKMENHHHDTITGNPTVEIGKNNYYNSSAKLLAKSDGKVFF